MKTKLISRAENFSQWYNEIIKSADLAEHSQVRGSMIIRPYGFALWENIKSILDGLIKASGHDNVYFPALIPKSYFSTEAQHIEGFAKECLVITHSRLKKTDSGIAVDDNSKLEEELILRPTSETLFWRSYKTWISSYRDLPIKLNQWANVFRWEMRPRMFTRTTEILWQEGHTVHMTEAEAIEETERMWKMYASFAQQFMAMPLIKGEKTQIERFAGALKTYTLEGLMQDGKALQMGTSHFLGQNFAKAFDVKFAQANGEMAYPWGTSWGITTRLLGAIIMMHGDDKGLVLPPLVAPIQVVVIPVNSSLSYKDLIENKIKEIKDNLEDVLKLRVKIDANDNRSLGWKMAEYEIKGVPLRIVIGQQEIDNGSFEIFRRDTLTKYSCSFSDYASLVDRLLKEIHKNLYEQSLMRLNNSTVHLSSLSDLYNLLPNLNGFLKVYWSGDMKLENDIARDYGVTIRCLLHDEQEGKCVISGAFTNTIAVFARSY